MTLLELLVKELPGRGGWPKGIEKISQSPIDGELYLFKPCEILTGRGIYFFEVSDLCCIKVHKRQYEAAIAAQQPVWNGEGLPTTGVKCEWQDYNTKKWIPVRVVYSSEWVTIISEDKYDDAIELAIENYGDKGRRKFRPLRTEEDRKRDIAVGAMEKSWESATDKPAYGFERIYDAIAAGKIPGIELSK